MKKNLLISALKFSVIWILAGMAAGVFEHMNEKPRGVHQSAQCDRASLAQNYYYGGFRFFYPEVNENRCYDGIVSCEMPLVSFMAAALYKVFGYDEFYFRLISYLFFSLGMMALFFLFKTRMGSLAALALVLLLHFSPILLFYSANFLPDIFSLGFILAAWLLFYRMHIRHLYLPSLDQKWIQLIFIVLLGTGMAVKTTSGIQWFSMGILLLCSYIPGFKLHLLQRRKLISSLAFSALIPFLWYLWSRHLSMVHNPQYFMMRIPFSESWQSYEDAWNCYLANWPFQTLSDPIIYIAVLLLVLTLFLKRFIQAELWFISVINTFGSIAFMFLMIEQFKYHDYYVICLFPAFALNWLALGDVLRKTGKGWWWIKIAILAVLLYGLNYQYLAGKNNLKERYTEGNYWEQSHHRVSDLDSFRMILQSLGINRNHCVAAGYDEGPNNMLYLLHLRGHRLSKDHDENRFHHVLFNTGIQYFISNDSTLSVKVQSKAVHAKRIAEYKYLQLFQMK